ncbi:MAG TPA: lytic transglycosylase, partial [Cupriavidus sp.]|nr:lytic transglycosylase [Cupriavidus sp.]
SVWNTESSRGQRLNSPAGAKGHFQFMDATARQYGVADPYDLKQSATGAARMYSDLLKANGGDLDKALAGYNWGQGNVNSKGLQNAPKETRDYIAKVRSQMGGGSLYAGQSTPIVAANQPGGAPVSGGGDAGKVQVEIVLANAPAGTRASAKTSGNVSASVRIGNANVTGPSV